ncbi:unnamed protein product [Effrenium voratum]|nr:unnamed protein product [Effrenium voratum]
MTFTSSPHDNHRVLKSCPSKGLTQEYGPSSLRDSPEVMLEAVRMNIDALEYGTQKVRSEPAILQEAVKRSWRAVEHAAKLDAGSVLKALEKDWRAISVYLDSLSCLEEVEAESMKEMIRRNPQVVRDPRLSGEKMVVLRAVKQDGLVLRFASPELQDDEAICYAAVKQTWRALEFASARLQGKEELVDLALKQEGLALQFACPELRSRPKLVMRAMTRNIAAFQFADPRLHKDTNFWEELTRRFPTAWVRWMKFGRGVESPGFSAPRKPPKKVDLGLETVQL